MSNTTVKHKGSVRNWKGTVAQWDKHKDCIIHWCDGGEVEWLNLMLKWVLPEEPRFSPAGDYRKKPEPKREPKAGEVWELSSGAPCIYTEAFSGGYTFLALGGETVYGTGYTLTYTAASVEEYYTKKLEGDE